MCTILFAYQVHPTYNLIVAANRDEFYKRPTAAAHYWKDSPHILAGRDLEKMGTWMGVTTTGRFAAVTNFRDPKEMIEGKRSRGELVANILRNNGDLKKPLTDLLQKNNLYPGYNLLAGDSEELYYYSNIEKRLQQLKPGIYGLSNHLLNTDWPKVTIGRENMAQIINQPHDEMVEQLFKLLQDTTVYPDKILPKTGVGPEWERILSSLFIKSEQYGTKSSTVLLMNDKVIQFTERVFSKKGTKEQRYLIKNESSSYNKS